ncbi:hypothetical protein Btru_029710 [Bulinus truncatus]|nr:hypothetical protein Btru_029710 [Bulinus truncatus]
MATSISLGTFVGKSILRNTSSLRISLSSSKLNVALKSTHRAHNLNYNRTNAEVAQALRPKQNFLHFEMVDKHRSLLQKGTEMVQTEVDLKAPRDFRKLVQKYGRYPTDYIDSRASAVPGIAKPASGKSIRGVESNDDIQSGIIMWHFLD